MIGSGYFGQGYFGQGSSVAAPHFSAMAVNRFAGNVPQQLSLSYALNALNQQSLGLPSVVTATISALPAQPALITGAGTGSFRLVGL